MQVAQASRRFLDIRLELKYRIVRLRMALARERREIAPQFLRAAPHELRPPSFQVRPRARAPTEEAPVEKTRSQLEVAVMQSQAFANVPHGMAQAQTGIPDLLHEGAHGDPARLQVDAVRQQNQHVDI